MDQLRINTTSSFWKVALGFFPFYSNLQKRIGAEESDIQVRKKQNITPQECCAEVEFTEDHGDVPDIEELSMGSGWSSASDESNSGSVVQSPSTPYPTDEEDDAEDLSIGDVTVGTMSYSNSFFNFARTPSTNVKRKQKKQEGQERGRPAMSSSRSILSNKLLDQKSVCSSYR